MRDESKRNLRVGLLAAAALAVVAVAILTIGQRQQLFIRHTRYYTAFRNVSGLQPGAPVNLNGVTVGFVERLELPTGPENERIRVRFTVDANYTERVRQDTVVQIKTVGLLGDKYLELRGGSPAKPRVLEGGLVEGKDFPEMEQFVDRGEDLVNNLLAISSSLRVILSRVEAGEGLIGEMTVGPESGEKLLANFNATLTSVRSVVERVDRGEGLLGRMVTDDVLARSVLADVQSASAAMSQAATVVAGDVQRDDTVYAAVLHDREGKRLLIDTLTALRDGSQALAAVAEELTTGEGTLPRLLKDRQYADDFLTDLHGLVRCLHAVAAKLDRGEGTAGAFLNDPQMYQDLENVVRGVKSSKVVSWYVRNRRAKGETLVAREPAAPTPVPSPVSKPGCDPTAPPGG